MHVLFKIIQDGSKKFPVEYQMLSISDEILKEDCKRLIEEKLGWGHSTDWTNRDFDQLSEKIFEATGVNLSQTTLKRIWGKVKYDSAPTVTTLNTLAQFLGFEQWRDFRQKQSQLQENKNEKEETSKLSKQQVPGETPHFHTYRLPHFSTWPLIAGLVLVCGILSWNYFSTKSPAS